MSKSEAMKLFAIGTAVSVFATLVGCSVSAQTLASPSNKSSDAVQLEALAKKIDEQSAKIDILSQQILKLQQQFANPRPGVMIGEPTPPPGATTAPVETPQPANGNTHVVQRGETLTSIAKMYNVSVGELQKHNHIENDRKLQIGQTLLIPASPTPAPASSPSTSD